MTTTATRVYEVARAAWRMAESWGVRIALAVAYGSVLVACRLRGTRRRKWSPTGRLLVCGTFHNPNWVLSHLTPLARSGLAEVVVVADRAHEAVERVRFVCPPRWASALLGRTFARLTWTFVTGARIRPDAYMGYFLFPNSLVALLASCVFGRPACYQMTSGPVEVKGGGYYTENRVLARLHRPSRLVERLALSVVGQFDLVVVRGTRARNFLQSAGVKRPAVIVPGSVDPARLQPTGERPYDLLYVGRANISKQPHRFVDLVARLARHRPGLRAALVGDGPLLEAIRRRVDREGLRDQLQVFGQRRDVDQFFGRARVFVLTSRNEGLSIAMAEAMMSGAVPVVPDVGDLGDLVKDGVNGFLVAPDDEDELARRAEELLADRALWTRLSEAARDAARTHNGLEHVSSLWSAHLAALRDVHPTAGGAVAVAAAPGTRG